MKKVKVLHLLLIIGAISFFQSGYSQESGNCLDFDGNDDHVLTDFCEDLNTWTIECWVYSYSAPEVSSTSGPIQRGNNFQINWNHEESAHLGTVSVNVEGIMYYAEFGFLPGDTWIHLAATYNGENLIAYKNGLVVEDNKEPSGNPSSESCTLSLGKHTVEDYFFHGRIDELRIWDVARTLAEIQQDMYNYNITSSHPE